MAIEYVDSTQLDSDLTSVANAIRAKSGGSSQLAFPAGFVSEIQAIPSGMSLDDFLSHAKPSGEVTLSVVPVTTYQSVILKGFSNLTRINITSTFTAPGAFLSKNSNLVTVFAPKVTCSGNTYFAEDDNKLKTVVIRKINTNYALAHCNILEKVDIQEGAVGGNGVFEKDYALKTIILRSSSVQALANVNAFANTPFKSGGSGGTIYIPKVLYDALGTGTNDYKAASNWATIDGYGTITWAQIEGSAYDGYYADGTPIPTT